MRDEYARPLPDKQIAAAFVWKAAQHAEAYEGRVCLVLPHGVLFNHSDTARRLFSAAWVRSHAFERVHQPGRLPAVHPV